MSVPPEKVAADSEKAIEAKHDTVVPAKAAGFGVVSVKLDLSGFDDEKQTLVIEALANGQRVAYMELRGGPRQQTNIIGERIADPDTLIFETSSNREHKGEVVVTTTIKGADVAKTPFEVATR